MVDQLIPPDDHDYGLPPAAPVKVLCFFPGTQFEQARRRYSDYATLTFDQYLAGQEDTAAELAAAGNTVVIREVDWDRLDQFAAERGLDPSDPATLVAFPGLDHVYDGYGTLVAVHMADAAVRLVMQCAQFYGVAIDSYQPIVEEAWAELRRHWQSSVSTKAVLTFATLAPTETGTYPVTTDLDLTNNAGAIELATSAHIAMLENLLLLGCINGGGLVLRSFDPVDPDSPEPPGKAVYGWTLGPNGLAGLSEPALFDACCIGPTGELMPPEPGARYVATT
jgi:hypothetical protein